MVSVIEEHYESLKKLCEKYSVKRLELFGSATQDKFEPERSDLDFLVEFLALKQGEYADAYFGLLESLEELFGRHVDLVMLGAVKNPYFLEAIETSREVLYAA